MKTPRRKTGRAAGETAIALGPLDGLIGFNLRMAQDASFAVYAQHSHAEHMRPGRFASLMIIDRNPGLTQADLGQATARDKSSITPLVKGLERDGLIERRKSSEDRRSVTLWLTAAGLDVLQSLVAHAQDHDRKLDELVGADGKAEFLRLLKKITTELT